MKTYQVNKEGYYGEFGGAYIPEILHRCVEELQNAYSKVLESEGFKQEFHGRHGECKPSVVITNSVCSGTSSFLAYLWTFPM